MIIGDPTIFAIESKIYEISKRASLRGLGYFVVHVDGKQFGVKSPTATMLANSFDEVCRRLAERGSHFAAFAVPMDAHQLADSVHDAVYAQEPSNVDWQQIASTLEEKRLIWAPDGDAAFDDGSVIVQIDLGEQVRLLAFRNPSKGRSQPRDVSEVWIDAESYYGTLRDWSEKFLKEWTAGTEVVN